MAIPEAKGHVTSTGFLPVYYRCLCRVTPQGGGFLEIRSFNITKPCMACTSRMPALWTLTQCKAQDKP